MRKNREIKVIFAVMAVFFAGFLAVPMISVLIKSFTGNGEAASLSHYIEVLTGRGFLRALGNSFARFPARPREQLRDLHMQRAAGNCTGIYPCLHDPLYKCRKAL